MKRVDEDKLYRIMFMDEMLEDLADCRCVELQKRVKELEAKLLEYSWHKQGCAVGDGAQNVECLCGWEDLYMELVKETGE